jgi:hypothetical protein
MQIFQKILRNKQKTSCARSPYVELNIKVKAQGKFEGLFLLSKGYVSSTSSPYIPARTEGKNVCLVQLAHVIPFVS